MDLLYKELKGFGKVKLDEPLSKHTTFKIGGPAKYFVEITKSSELPKLLSYLDSEGVEFFILGGGSNLLVRDEGFDGVVIKNKVCDLKVENNLVTASAGCATVEVARKSIEEGLTGFEWGVGVPGTIGGAVRGNAGAMGGDMSESVKEVTVYDGGEELKLNNENCKFGYRDSIFKHTSAVILTVVIELKKSVDKEGMREAIKNLQYRNITQPQGYSSSGCIFKNYEVKNEEEKEALKLKGVPTEFLGKGIVPTGWLVENSGLKGKSIGGTSVSDKHCNFIVSTGSATASDIVNLIEKIKSVVYHKYGVYIEEEIKIL
jgi:UDP-N-acetylmuramate dehydrogenase